MSAKKSTDRVVWDGVIEAPDHLQLPDSVLGGAMIEWVTRLREFRAAMSSLDRVVVIGYDDNDGVPHLWVGSIPEKRS